MTPERICHVSQTQFSVARHYGGCTLNGRSYIYDPTTDTLVRADVHAQERGEAKRAKQEAARAAKERRLAAERTFNFGEEPAW